MSVELSNETETPVDFTPLRALVTHVYAQMGIHPDSELFVRFVSPEASAELHVHWMDLPGATDVMSFPMDELSPGDPQPGTLGDIVICPAVAADQAQAHGHTTADELLLLLTHGLLHLMGFDHAEDSERLEMFGLQRKLLLTFFAAHEPGRTHVPEPTLD